MRDAMRTPEPIVIAHVSTALEEQLLREATAMASYALASGKPVGPSIVDAVHAALAAHGANADNGTCRDGTTAEHHTYTHDIAALTRAHAQLTLIGAPAAPRAVLLLARGADGLGRWGILGPIRMVRYLLALALLSLIGLMLLGTSEHVTATSGNIFKEAGLTALLNALFLLCAASVGAAFSGLFRINLYIAATTYDPQHDASYWVQYGLGLIAGFLLATIIPASDTSAGAAIGRPVLALVGGFSASLLYRVLDRLSRTIESMLDAPPQAGVVPRQDEERTSVGSATGGLDPARWQRLELLGVLSEMQHQLGSTGAADGLKPPLRQRIRQLTAEGSLSPEAQSLPRPSEAAVGRARRRTR